MEIATLTEAERHRLAMDALRDPQTHGLPAGQSIEMIETHGAMVFLAGPKAWKIKKPADFGYMDFSTLDRRAWALGREARINLAWAPHLYRGVVPLCRATDGRIALGGEGDVIDFALEMVRFDPTQVLATLADQGRLDGELAEGAARAAARGEGAAPIVPDRCPVDAVAMVIASNETCLLRHRGTIDPDRVIALSVASTAALETIKPLLEQRAAAGLLRQCHADMHLGNIVLIEGQPTPFDGIEFSDAFAQIDVAYDAAFLLMDLWRRGLRAEAARALSAWMDESQRIFGQQALDALAFLPLFQSLRAVVRAHCAADAGDFDQTLAFLDQAEAMLAGSPARLVAVGGLSGSGKTTLARGLAPSLASAPGALVLRSDEIRKRLAGVAPLERLGPEHYTAEVSARVYATLLDEAERALRAGRTVIADAVFGGPMDQRAMAAMAHRVGVPFNGIWLDAPTDVRVARVGARRGDASDADIRVAAGQSAATLTEGWSSVDASQGPETALRQALTLL